MDSDDEESSSSVSRIEGDVEPYTSKAGNAQINNKQVVVETSVSNQKIKGMCVESPATNEDRFETGPVNKTTNSTQLTDSADLEPSTHCTPLNISENANQVCVSTSKLNFAKIQEQDASLSHFFELARAGSDKYFLEDGILYRRAIGGCDVLHDKLLRVPSCYREQLVRTAHDSMWSAHSGARRTAQRVSALFFFPRMHSYITSLVRKCPVCQHLAPIKKRDRVPLNEPPVID